MLTNSGFSSNFLYIGGLKLFHIKALLPEQNKKSLVTLTWWWHLLQLIKPYSIIIMILSSLLLLLTLVYMFDINLNVVCWLWTTYTNIRHDLNTDTSIRIIIYENDIIKCNHRCYVGHWYVSDTETHLFRGVLLLHSFLI